MKNKKYLIAVLWCLAGMWVVFIWWNSTRTGEVSGDMSGGVTATLNSILQKIFPQVEISHRFVRKAAHFCEFGMLAWIFCFAFYITFDLKLLLMKTTKLCRVLLALPCAMLVAATDETIQLFVEGRGASVVDVMIDSLGALCFTAIFFFALLLIKFLHRQKPVD